MRFKKSINNQYVVEDFENKIIRNEEETKDDYKKRLDSISEMILLAREKSAPSQGPA